MAMRPKLWTLNGLSVELGVGARRSRRACLCARPERKAVTGRTLHIKSQRLVREMSAMKKFKPDGWRTITPRIFTNDVAGVVGFLKAVFDARGEERIGVPAKVQIGDSIVMTSDGGGQREAMPAFLYVYVEDADRTYQRAVETGAASIEKPIDTPYGDRRATVRDSWGNVWQIATHQEDR
jgi:PhnB protein